MPNDFTSPFDKRWIQIVGKAWMDDTFKQQLLADPGAVLKANGIPVPAGVTVKAVENTDKVIFVTLPAKPKGLTQEGLNQATSASFWDDITKVIGQVSAPVGPLLGALGI
jgi:hypothetical protein